MNLIKKYTSIAFSALFMFSSIVYSPVGAARGFSYKVTNENKKTAILTKIDTNESLELKDPIDGYSIIEIADNASSFKRIKDSHWKRRLLTFAALNISLPLYLFVLDGLAEGGLREFNMLTTDISYSGPKITSVVLPNCTRIGKEGLLFCDRLKSVDLPQCKILEQGSLRGCTSINKLNIPQCTRIDDFFDIVRKVKDYNYNILNRHPKYSYPHYEYPLFEELNAPSCTEITEKSFYEFKGLKKANLQSCQKIGRGAFKGCKSLQTLDLPNCTEALSFYYGWGVYGAFEGCENLESINIPNLISIGDGCFRNCKALKKIDLSKCKEIKKSCCENCVSLTTALLDASTEIENNAFKKCNSLENVRMPNVVSIGEGAFYGTALKRVDLPNCNSIGKAAFNDCKKLTIFNSPNLTSIGESAFEGCENLEEIELPNCTVLGKNAFKDCKNLKKITIPKSCKLEGDCISYDLVIDGKLKVVKI